MSVTDRWRFGFLKQAGIVGFRAYDYAVVLARNGLDPDKVFGLTEDYLKSLGIKSDEDVSLILEYALTVADAAITNDDDDNDKTESNHASNNNNSKNNHRGLHTPSPQPRRKQTEGSNKTVGLINDLVFEQPMIPKFITNSSKPSLQEKLDSLASKLPKTDARPESEIPVSSPPKSDSNTRKGNADTTSKFKSDPTKPENSSKTSEWIDSSAKKPKLSTAEIDFEEKQGKMDEGKVFILVRSWNNFQSRQVIRIPPDHPSLRKVPIRRLGFSQLMALKTLPLQDTNDAEGF